MIFAWTPGCSRYALVVGDGSFHGVQRLDDLRHLGELDGAAAVLVVHLMEKNILML
jgi:hypothetical protein